MQQPKPVPEPSGAMMAVWVHLILNPRLFIRGGELNQTNICQITSLHWSLLTNLLEIPTIQHKSHLYVKLTWTSRTKVRFLFYQKCFQKEGSSFTREKTSVMRAMWLDKRPLLQQRAAHRHSPKLSNGKHLQLSPRQWMTPTGTAPKEPFNSLLES